MYLLWCQDGPLLKAKPALLFLYSLDERDPTMLPIASPRAAATHKPHCPPPSTVLPDSTSLDHYRKLGLKINLRGIVHLNSWNFCTSLRRTFPWRALGDPTKDAGLDSAWEELKHHSKTAHGRLGSLV